MRVQSGGERDYGRVACVVGGDGAAGPVNDGECKLGGAVKGRLSLGGLRALGLNGGGGRLGEMGCSGNGSEGGGGVSARGDDGGRGHGDRGQQGRDGGESEHLADVKGEDEESVLVVVLTEM